MRILAMDVGDRRIGMAVSDIMGWTAQGIDTLERKSQKYDMEQIATTIDLDNPEKLVLGLPRNMNGTIGPQGEKVKEFGNLLKKEVYQGEMIYWDERLTSVLANRIMIDADVSRKRRKQSVDRMAAIFILQSYLDFINSQGKGE